MEQIDNIVTGIQDLFTDVQVFLGTAQGKQMIAGGASALIAAIVTGYLTNYLQNKRADVIPAMDTGLDRIIRPSIKEDTETLPSGYTGAERMSHTNEAIRFYAGINEMVLSTFAPAWNDAREKNSYENFTLNVQRLDMLAAHVENDGNALLQKLEPYAEIGNALIAAGNSLEEAWKERHYDHTHTEYHRKTRTNSKGETETYTESEEVYDYTESDFWFHPEHLETAMQTLNDLFTTFSLAQLYDPDMQNLTIEATESDAAEIRETVLEDADAEISLPEVGELMDEWIDKAVANTTIAIAQNDLGWINSNRESYHQKIMTAKPHYNYISYKYDGYEHPGPKQYQMNEKLKGVCWNLGKTLQDMYKSVQDGMQLARELGNLTSPLLLTGKEEKPEDTARHMYDVAVKLYNRSFPESEIDLDQRVSGVLTGTIAVISALVFGIGGYLVAKHFELGVPVPR